MFITSDIGVQGAQQSRLYRSGSSDPVLFPILDIAVMPVWAGLRTSAEMSCGEMIR